MRSIAVMNQKGGVGKTTTAVNISAALAETGLRICLIDLDPQAHATLHLGIEPRPGAPGAPEQPVKILTSCPACLQGLSRYEDDTGIEADYIVVEMAKHLMGENWMQEYIAKANQGGIEKVLL